MRLTPLEKKYLNYCNDVFLCDDMSTRKLRDMASEHSVSTSVATNLKNIGALAWNGIRGEGSVYEWVGGRPDGVMAKLLLKDMRDRRKKIQKPVATKVNNAVEAAIRHKSRQNAEHTETEHTEVSFLFGLYKKTVRINKN